VPCRVQSGEDEYDTLNCRVLSAKEPLILGLFCGNYRQTRDAGAMSCTRGQRFIGCPKLQVSLRKKATDYGSLVRKFGSDSRGRCHGVYLLFTKKKGFLRKAKHRTVSLLLNGEDA